MPDDLPEVSNPRLQEWAALHPQLFWVYRGEVHASGRNLRSEDSKLTCWLLAKGEVEVTSKLGVLHARAGSWVIPPTVGRYQHFSPDARFLSLSFRVDWPGGLALYDPGVGMVVAAQKYPVLEQVAVRLCELVERDFPQAGNQLFLEAGSLGQHWHLNLLFADWLGAFSAMMEQEGRQPVRPNATDLRLARALHYIDRHALNLPFRQAEMAGKAGLSVAQLHRLFNRYLGKTPTERYEERRQQTALMLVEQTNRPLKAISNDLGFSSAAHFSRWFNQRLGCSPSEHRQGR